MGLFFAAYTIFINWGARMISRKTASYWQLAPDRQKLSSKRGRQRLKVLERRAVRKDGIVAVCKDSQAFHV